MDLDKGAKVIQWRKDSFFNITHTVYKTQLKIYNKLNIKHKTIKLLEGNIRGNLCEPGISKNVLATMAKAQYIKE